ncbi:RDD family protein [Cellulosimicrobium sp. NPDC057127]|uniref:RDD family protein n=1 Tax=Cellulosimicrobium sp. NPDC057127 TaxID=3346026 RepID=UPI003636AE89
MTQTATSVPAGPDGPAVAAPGTSPAPVDPWSPPCASWSRRVVGTLLDGAILTGATWLALGDDGRSPTLAPGIGETTTSSPTEPWTSSPWLLLVVVVMLALQGYTGATPGKRVAGVAVVRADTLLPTGFLAAVLRVVAHVADALLLLVGYLRPLWHAERRTFADSIVGTVVVQTREPPPHPWFARFRHAPDVARSTVVSVAAGLVCVLGVGFSTAVTSSGGSVLAVDAGCTFEDPGAGITPTAAGITHDEGWSTESRLWVTRDMPTSPSPVDARWEWSDPRPGTQLVRLEATITDRQGQDPMTFVQEPAQPADWSSSGQVAPDTARVPAETVARYPDGWTLTTRMLVDGAEVAACATTYDGVAPQRP